MRTGCLAAAHAEQQAVRGAARRKAGARCCSGLSRKACRAHRAGARPASRRPDPHGAWRPGCTPASCCTSSAGVAALPPDQASGCTCRRYGLAVVPTGGAASGLRPRRGRSRRLHAGMRRCRRRLWPHIARLWQQQGHDQVELRAFTATSLRTLRSCCACGSLCPMLLGRLRAAAAAAAACVRPQYAPLAVSSRCGWDCGSGCSAAAGSTGLMAASGEGVPPCAAPV